MQEIKELEERLRNLETTIATLMKFLIIEGNGLAIRAKGDISIEARNIAIEADVGSSLKGEVSTEVSAGMETTITGAIVMIN